MISFLFFGGEPEAWVQSCLLCKPRTEKFLLAFQSWIQLSLKLAHSYLFYPFSESVKTFFLLFVYVSLT